MDNILSTFKKWRYTLIVCFVFLSCEGIDKDLVSSKQELPHIFIITDNGSIAWEKEPCTVNFTHNNQNQSLTATMKARGGVSKGYLKNSFALELDEKYKFDHLPKDDDWVLNANFIDKTFMRHKLAYDIYRDMNPLNTAAKCDYVNVSVNGNYYGLYVLMEEINAGMISLDKSDSLAMLFEGPPVFNEDSLTFIKDINNYYHQKFPKINQLDRTAFMEGLRWLVFNSTNQEFDAEIQDWIDINNFIDWYIILQFSGNGDGIFKNFYIYKIDSKTPFRIAIWDYDDGMGRSLRNKPQMIDGPLNVRNSLLFDRLFKSKTLDFGNKVKNRWFELRSKNIITYNSIAEKIAANDRLIRLGLHRNVTKWSNSDPIYKDDLGYMFEKQILLDYTKVRIPILDAYFQGL